MFKFARVDATASHLILFEPDKNVFLRLIKRRLLPGKIDRDEKGQTTGSLTIDGLSERDLRRISGQGIDARTLFQEDPSTVLIRARWRLF